MILPQYGFRVFTDNWGKFYYTGIKIYLIDFF